MLTPTAQLRDGPLVLTITSVGATRTVSIAGELDMSNTETLGSLLDELERDGAEAIILDLEALDFVDSSGLALLVASDRHLNRGGGGCLRLIPSRATGVRRVLEATGLDRRLPFVESGRVPV